MVRLWGKGRRGEERGGEGRGREEKGGVRVRGKKGMEVRGK